MAVSVVTRAGEMMLERRRYQRRRGALGRQRVSFQTVPQA
jgi:hypothetical protein